MQKAISTLKNGSFVILSFGCLLMTACEPSDSADLVEKGGYPRTYPVFHPNPHLRLWKNRMWKKSFLKRRD